MPMRWAIKLLQVQAEGTRQKHTLEAMQHNCCDYRSKQSAVLLQGPVLWRCTARSTSNLAENKQKGKRDPILLLYCCCGPSREAPKERKQ